MSGVTGIESAPAATIADQEPALLVHVFRVEEGLGNACLLQFPDGTCGILDWGTQRTEPLERALAIASEGGFRFVAASHAHADHTLGLAKLIRACHRRGIRVQRFVYPASTLNKESADLTKARVAALECGIPMSPVAVDTFQAPAGEWRPPYLAWAEDRSWEVRVLSPSMTETAIAEMRALGRSVVPGNETSLVVLFRFVDQISPTGLGRALLPGDATPATLEFARETASSFAELAMKNQMFLVPHHGSRQNLPDWLEEEIRGIVVVSAPTDSLNHPAGEVLQRIGSWIEDGSRLFCTSYAQCCAKDFGRRARGANRALVQPGSCFGDVVVRVPRSAPAELEQSSQPGERRRRFGYCGGA
ncbi:hypothetical protein [uncultured Paludibaculum sp.]|uniref:hypothetical protein n=1 Tax=uncultured Paludibaculum sp. TaxID=1765020 RepID=UPI002AAA83C7|nr:hypothetical protein [uncultured Paludibaculum sp.]